MTVNINVPKDIHYKFLSDYPNDIKLTVYNTVDELLASNGIVLITHLFLVHHAKKILSSDNVYILYMPTEGTNTISNVLKDHWPDTHRIPFIVSSGDFWSGVYHINLDMFRVTLGRTIKELEEIDWVTHNNIFSKLEKPFIFNCLNGVKRPHRQNLIKFLDERNLLDKSLWTALYDKTFLPEKYQFEFVEDNISSGQYIKDDDWPAGRIHPPIYEDTYVSIVTETNFDIPYSYRTEKIYKPLKIGHPFIAVSSYGFYRDLHKIGFKTFGDLIDESFDTIDNNGARLLRIFDVIEDLGKSNLKEFLIAAKDSCVHNRNLMLETIDIRDNKELLSQFIEKINSYAKTK